MPALIAERYPAKLLARPGHLAPARSASCSRRRCRIILYGIVANVLLDKLFLAGLIPGILTVLALSRLRRLCTANKAKIERTPFDAKQARPSRSGIAKWELGLPVVLIGGMATGLLRVHEASAFTALYVLFIEVVIYREISLTKDLPRIVRESMTLVGAILAILSTAIGFTGWLIQAQIPMKMLAAMEIFITSQFMFLLVLNMFLLIVGMVMDIFAAIFVVVPLIIPIATSLRRRPVPSRHHVPAQPRDRLPHAAAWASTCSSRASASSSRWWTSTVRCCRSSASCWSRC